MCDTQAIQLLWSKFTFAASEKAGKVSAKLCSTFLFSKEKQSYLVNT